MRKKIIFFCTIVVFAVFNFNQTLAQEENIVNYENDVILDSDLDGLTDEGENQIYKTDLNNPDSDGDGILDGAEIINRTDPLDNTVPSARQIITESLPDRVETPWAWYLARSTGIIGFILLYVSIFLGVSARTPILKKIIQPAYFVKAHGWISLQSLFFALIHGFVLIFDRFAGLSLVNIFIPFAQLPESAIQAGLRPAFLNLGIIGFYLMLILVATSYFKKFMSQRVWRFIHFSNVLLYVFVVAHTLALGTDMRSPLVRNIFIAANAALAILMVINIIYRVYHWISSRKNSYDENLRQGGAQIFPEGSDQNFRRRI